ncbi:MAG: hypothetical protein K8S97_08510 [Anaerolineae bacterium]|nr:hypothetical protein [Anaerolineae bacterium]
MSSTTLKLPRIDGRTSLAKLLLRRVQVVRYLANAENRAGVVTGWHERIWAGMADHYRDELATLDRYIDRKQTRSAENPAHKKAAA